MRPKNMSDKKRCQRILNLVFPQISVDAVSISGFQLTVSNYSRQSKKMLRINQHKIGIEQIYQAIHRAKISSCGNNGKQISFESDYGGWWWQAFIATECFVSLEAKCNARLPIEALLRAYISLLLRQNRLQWKDII